MLGNFTEAPSLALYLTTYNLECSQAELAMFKF